MLTQAKISELPTITHQNQINTYCNNLFDSTDLSFFEYIKISPDGSAGSLLTNFADGLKTSLQNGVYCDSCFVLHPDQYQPGAYLWSDIYDNFENLALRKSFGYKNGITIIYKTKEACHLFGFSSLNDTVDINRLFRYHIELLKLFCRQFLIENDELVERAWDARIPLKHKPESKPFIVNQEQASLETLQTQLIADFRLSKNKPDLPNTHLLGQLDCEIKSINHCHNTVSANIDQLSTRERSCLIGVIQGLTSRDIANKLCLSFRTVENYIERLKLKLDCPRKNDLIVRYGCLS